MINFVKNVLERNPVEVSQINSFIEEYVSMKKKDKLTPEQLEGINKMIQLGIFNIEHAVKEYIKEKGWQVTTITDIQGTIIRVNIDEK